MPQANEPFVPVSDRPEVRPDARVADLTVRDLLGVLLTSGTTLKPAFADFKIYAKPEFWKIEHIKIELWKVEHGEIPHLGPVIGPGPEIVEIVQGIAGLRAQVDKLSSEVAELRKEKR